MDKFVIHGPNQLNGELRIAGSKNTALAVLFSTLLSEDVHHVGGVPDLQDMSSTMKMLLHFGARVEANHHSAFGCDWKIDSRHLNDLEAPYDLVRKMRASILCLGPTLARRGWARVSLPGGCAIGARPVDLHLFAMEKLGAQIEQRAGYVEARIPQGRTRLKGASIVFPMVSVGATENAVCAAVLAEGTTIIENAAREPDVQHLCEALRNMGARIEGDGGSQIVIQGVERLGGLRWEIPSDRIEAATYAIAAQMTGGAIRLTHVKPGEMAVVLDALEQSGATVERGEQEIFVKSSAVIQPVSIRTEPYPGFPTDVQAQWMALMTQADGVSTIHESIFENRFMHVPELVRLGADLEIHGNKVTVKGSRGRLEGAQVMATDLRASASLVLAGLVARGETHVKRIYHLDRGYESMEQKLRSLGADVERMAE